MGYRIVEFDGFFLEDILKNYDAGDAQEFFRLDKPLPADAEFTELRVKSGGPSFQAVFSSSEWSEEDNFEIIQVVYQTHYFYADEVAQLEGEEEMTHEHDWESDGESYRKRTCNCSIDDTTDKTRHIIDNDSHYSRFRRYTCHCGESKVVEVEE